VHNVDKQKTILGHRLWTFFSF